MSRILAVGIAVLDVINFVDEYPGEDAEVRASSQIICRGGNATNSLVVLSQLGYDCSWSGVIADDVNAQFLLDDLSRYHINVSDTVTVTGYQTPVSTIIISDEGSRTIVHYRDLPELSYSDFNMEQAGRFDWIHFEGRNVNEIRKIMQEIKLKYPEIPVSVELEKPRESINSLIEYASYVFYSKIFMQALNFDDPELFLSSMYKDYPDKEHYCAYGEQGVYAVDMNGEIFFGKAKNNINVIDTVGAGDTLNSGIIHANLQKLEMGERLQVACEMAARKCSQQGFSGLDMGEL